MEQEHKRRVRYKGTHPRSYKEKYKELNPEKYRADVEKIVQSGKTPAGMHISIMVEEILDFLQIQPGQVGLDATLGYGGHTLLPHPSISRYECPRALLGAEAAPHLPDGACEASEARAARDCSAQVAQLYVAMGIDKTRREGTRIELRMRHCIQPLPLLHADNAAIVIERNDGARGDATAINKVVGCYTAHITYGLVFR